MTYLAGNPAVDLAPTRRDSTVPVPGTRSTPAPAVGTVTGATLTLALRKADGDGVAGQVLLDPCCGSGTILAEADIQGWEPVGGDLDPVAIEVARQNLGRTARLFSADVRRLPVADASVAAVASNLPFGRQYDLQGRPESWFAGTLGELVRVTRPAGSIVLLVPRSSAFQRALVRQSGIQLCERMDLRLLGMKTALWSLRRR